MRQFLRIIGLFVLLSTISAAQDDRVSMYLEEGKSGAVWDVAMSPDGKVIYSCGRDSTVKMWSTVNGECLRTMRAERATLNTALALSTDGLVLAVGDMNGRITVYDAVSGNRRAEFPAGYSYVTDLCFMPDGRGIAVSGRNDSIAVYDTDGRRRFASAAGSVWVTGIAVSRDGALLASAGQDGTVRLWNAQTGAAVALLGRHSRFARCVEFTPDNTTLLSGGRDRIVRAWDVRKRAPMQYFETGIGFPHHLSFDRSGKTVAVSMMDGLVEVWDWQKSLRVRAIPESYGAMASVFEPKKGERITTAHIDGAVKTWRVKDAAQLVSMVGFSDGQWLSFTPDGYYDCSVFGDRYVQWRRGEELFPLERYEALYKKPSVIEDALAGTYAPEARLARVIDPPMLELLSPRHQQLFAFGSEKMEIVVEFRARDKKKIESAQLRLNGRPVADENLVSSETLTRSETELVRRVRLEVLPGINVIEAVAYNAARVHSKPAQAVIKVETADQQRANLFVLSVGVDQYGGAFPDLTYAALDANMFAQKLAAQEGKEYTRVYSKVLLNKDASRKGVLDAIAQFPPMRSNDMLVLFFSGHGVRARNTKGGTEYFFVTAGAARKTVARDGLSWEDVARQIMRLRAGRVVMLLDACHSGEVSSGASNDKVAGALANKVGIILASSSGNEYSFENREWGHGAFTKALIDGLSGNADFTKNNIIDWSELQLYVTTTVKELTRGAQTPMIPRLEEFANFNVARVR